jgi:hypothetical protein
MLRLNTGLTSRHPASGRCRDPGCAPLNPTDIPGDLHGRAAFMDRLPD